MPSVFWTQTYKHVRLFITYPEGFRLDFDTANNCVVFCQRNQLRHCMPPLYRRAQLLLVSERDEFGEVEMVFRKRVTALWPRMMKRHCFVIRHPVLWRAEDELSEPSDDSVSCASDEGDCCDEESQSESSEVSVDDSDKRVQPDADKDVEEDDDYKNMTCTPDDDVLPAAEQHDGECLAPTLTKLDLESICHILSFLPVMSVGRCSRVSRALGKLVAANHLWKQLCERDLPQSSERLSGFINSLRRRAPRFRDPNSLLVRLDELVHPTILRANIIDWSQPVLSNAPVAAVVKWKEAYQTLQLLTPIAIADQRNNRIKITRCGGSVLHICDANIQNPSGIVLLQDGRLAVTEFMNSSVLIFGCADEPNVSFQTGYLPRGLAQLPNGNLIVCQYGMSRVTIHTLSGEIVCHLNADFLGPSGVALVDDTGVVAVTECNGGRVRIFDTNANKTLRVIGYPEDDMEVDELELGEPRGIALLPGGLLAICDGGMNRITIATLAGKLVRHINGNFRCPAGIAVLPDGELIAVTDTDHHRVCIIRWRTGAIVRSLGTSTAGPGSNQFAFPRCVAVLSSF
jgi:hypothetical protein